MKALSTSLYNKVQRHGLKLTRKRVNILALFEALPLGTHLSVEDTQGYYVSQYREKIALSTLDKALKTFAKLNILQAVETARNHQVYEMHREDYRHHHLVCVHCHCITEFVDTSIDESGWLISQDNGYLSLGCTITLYGVCPNAPVSDKEHINCSNSYFSFNGSRDYPCLSSDNCNHHCNNQI